MEKTVNFSVFKEKIIKTNELLQLHLQKTRELEKVHKCYQQLKTKLELSKTEVQKFKLTNETLTYNLNSTEKKYATLQEEHDALKSRFDQLEKEFSETVNNLQINYQHTNQELKECNEKLSNFEKYQSPVAPPKSPTKKKKAATKATEEKYKTLQEQYDKLQAQYNQLQKEFDLTVNNLKTNNQQTTQELQKCKQKLTELEEESQNHKNNITQNAKTTTFEDLNKIKELQLDKQKLNKENSVLKLEIYELKQQQKYLKDDDTLEKLKTELDIREQKIMNLENTLKEIEANKKEEVDRLSKQSSEINSDIDKLKIDNEKLQNENNAFTLEVAMLQANDSLQHPQEIQKLEDDNKTLREEIKKLKEIIKNYKLSSNMSAATRHNSKTPTDQEIEDIMKEINFPSLLSPLNEVQEEEETLPPSAFNEENSHQLEDHIDPHDTEVERVREKQILSSSGKFTISTLSEGIKTTNSKKTRRKRLIRKKPKRIDLYKTLLALKKANLNFIISNESLKPLDRKVGPYLVHNTTPIDTRFKVLCEKKYATNNVTTKLECNLECCKSTYMVLQNGDDENAPLLGFFGVKSEKPSCIWDKMNLVQRSRRKRKKAENSTEQTQQKAAISSIEDYVNNTVHDPLPPQSEVESDHRPLDLGNSDNSLLHNGCSVHNENNVRKICIGKNTKRKSIISMKCNTKRARPSYVTRTVAKTVINSDDNDNLVIPVKKRIAHTPKLLSINNDHSDNQLYNEITQTSSTEPQSQTPSLSDRVCDQEIKDLRSAQTKSPKRTFKRPVCRTRRSPRFLSNLENVEEIKEKSQDNDDQPICPRSPDPSDEPFIASEPKIIPLDKVSENVKKMPPNKIEENFAKLLNFSTEEEALNEVVQEFANQEPEYIAEVILQKISTDFHDTADAKYYPAPLMTYTQRIMLGFMSKLEKTNVIGVFDSYLSLTEHRLLTCPVLQEIAPITRLYLAICKLRKDLLRMRRLCCDVFYFCGDFAVPFLFYVLTSWTEVLPHAAKSNEMPLAKVLVQIVYMKDCNKPGYNLMPLRDLLIKYFEYPPERWDSSELFQELFHAYLRNPVRSSDFALLLLCKNHPEKWVHEKIEEHLKPLVDKIPTENFKAAVIILMGNLYHPFNKKSDNNYLSSFREWLTNLITESTPDVVRRSVYLCLNRLAKK